MYKSILKEISTGFLLVVKLYRVVFWLQWFIFLSDGFFLFYEFFIFPMLVSCYLSLKVYVMFISSCKSLMNFFLTVLIDACF